MIYRFALRPSTVLSLQKGCLVSDATAAAIVSSANPMLMGSEHQRNAWKHAGRASVDAAIHAAAGPALLAACRALPPRRRRASRDGVGEEGGGAEERVATGGAVATAGGFGELRAAHVIHCACPRAEWGTEQAPAEDVRALRRTYASCLACAARLRVPSIAFPAVGIGVCAFPAAQAAQAALAALLGDDGACWPELREVQFVFREPRALEAWLAEAAARKLRPLPRDEM